MNKKPIEENAVSCFSGTSTEGFQFRKCYYLYVILPMIWLGGTYALFLILEASHIQFLAAEDGFFESLGALFLGIAGILFLLVYRRSRAGADLILFRTRKNIFFLLLGLLFLVGAMEEISWGQRIFQIETPEYIKELNAQDEITLHNLTFFQKENDEQFPMTDIRYWLNSNRVMTMFWTAFCCLLPFVYLTSKKVRTWLNRINVPIVPVYIGVAFLVNLMLNKLVILYTPETMIHHIAHANTEIKEATVEFLFFILAVWFFRNNEKNEKSRDFENLTQVSIAE